MIFTLIPKITSSPRCIAPVLRVFGHLILRGPVKMGMLVNLKD